MTTEITITEPGETTVVEVTGNQGPPGPAGQDAAFGRDRGVWSAGTHDYATDDAVTWQGSLYKSASTPSGEPGVDTAWVLRVSKGGKGDTGDAGTIHTGTGAPSGTGQTGEVYLDTATGNLYEYSAGWNLVGNIRGPAGSDGTDGSDGVDGDDGSQGAPGADGASGVVAATAPVTYNSGTKTVGVTVGTTSGSVAAGDDSRITGAAQKSANASDMTAASVRSNIGLGNAATKSIGTSSTDVAAGDAPAAAQSAATSAAAADATAKVAVETSNRQAADALLIPLTQRAAANGVATLDGTGTIPTSQIPSLALVTPQTAASQAAMLALTAQPGDVCIRSDLGSTWMLAAAPASTLANWVELSATGKVTSVNSQQGVIVLGYADVGADPSGAASSAQSAAISAAATDATTKANAAAAASAPAGRAITAGTGLAGGGTLAADRTISVASAGIDTAQLADSAVTSAKIADGTIVNADIAAGAAIASSKVAGLGGAASLGVGTSAGTVAAGDDSRITGAAGLGSNTFTGVQTGVRIPYAAKTSTYTVANTDGVIDCTSGTFTVTLPTAVGITGQQFVIKNSGTGVITVATTSSQTIDGASTLTLTTRYTSYTVISDGANWKVV